MELTDREKSVAVLVADGLTNRQVGNRLGLTEKSVALYVTRIYQKLGLSFGQENPRVRLSVMMRENGKYVPNQTIAK